MATNKKITELTEVELGGIADDDVLVIVDISENETKKVRRSTLRTDLAGVTTLAADSPLAVDTDIGDVTVSISGQVPVNNGGTGASTAAAARTNLGLGTISTQDYTNVNIDGGAIDGTPIGATTQSTGGFSSLTIASSTAVTSVDTDLTSVSASDDTLASAKAIKTYVDAQVGTVDTLSEILANGNTTGANNIIVTAGQSITVDTISETTAAGGVTVDSLLIKDGGITAAGTSTFAGQTISNLGTVTTADINGGNIDGTIIGASSAAAGTFTTGIFSGNVTISKAAATLAVTSTGAGQSNVIDLNSVNSDSSANDYRIGSGITGNNLFEIYDDNNSVPVYKYVESTPGHQWYVGGTALLNLTSTGLGIGVTSPNVKVQVGDGTSSQNIPVDGGSGTAEGGVFAIRQGGTYKGVLGTTAVIIGSGTSSDIRLQSYSDNIDIRAVAAKVITMATNDTTALTIDSSQNVGIGTTTPSSYYSWADNLVIAEAGNAGITIATGTSDIGQIYFADGTTSSAAYRGQINYSHSTDAMYFATAAVERMRIDSSGDVGIGTNSASGGYARIVTQGHGGGDDTGIQFTYGASAYGGGAITTVGAAGGGLDFWTHTGNVGSETFTKRISIVGSELGLPNISYITRSGTTNSNLTISGGSSNTLGTNIILYGESHANAGLIQFRSSTTERMRIHTNGNVGIGITDPSEGLLHVKKDDAGEVELLTLENSTGTGGIATMTFKTTSTDATKSAQIKAERTGGSGETELQFHTYNGSSTVENMVLTSAGELQLTGNGVLKNQESGGNFSYFQQTSSDARLYVQYSQPLLFGTNNTERMRIDSSGNIGIGTTSNIAGVGIELKKSGSYIGLNTTTVGYTLLRGYDNSIERWAIGQIGFGGADGFAVYTGTANTERMRIDSSGRVGLGTSSITGYDAKADNLVVYGGLDAGITVATGDASSETSIFFADGTTGADRYSGYVQYDHSTDSLKLASSSTVALTIDSSQAATFAGSLTGTTATFVTGTDTNGFSVLENSSGDQGIFMGVTGGAGSGNAYIKAGSLTSDSVGLIFQTASSGTESTALTLDSNKVATFAGAVFGDNVSGNAVFGKGNSAGDIYIGGGNANTNTIIFQIGSAEEARIDSDGLKFNGDTAAANALDDYEEGTFSPTLQFGGSSTGIAYTEQNGKYTKIGRLVFIEASFILSSKGSATGTAEIASLPFTAVQEGSSRAFAGCAYYDTMTGIAGGIVGSVQDNTTKITIGEQLATAFTVLDEGNFNNTTNIQFTAVYNTA